MAKRKNNYIGELWDNFGQQIIEDDLNRHPEKINKYKRNPSQTLHNTFRSHMIKQPNRIIKNVDREGLVVASNKFTPNLKNYLKGVEPTIIPKIQFKLSKTKTKRIYVYKRGRRGIFRNFPSRKAYSKWRKKQ